MTTTVVQPLIALKCRIRHRTQTIIVLSNRLLRLSPQASGSCQLQPPTQQQLQLMGKEQIRSFTQGFMHVLRMHVLRTSSSQVVPTLVWRATGGWERSRRTHSIRIRHLIGQIRR